MNAKIDIKTPAGKSLEGFPFMVQSNKLTDIICGIMDNGQFFWDCVGIGQPDLNPTLHKGDTITIEIL